jgi:hypothetical protein
MWVHFNPNPWGRRVGDCAIRAVSAALGVTWEVAYALVATQGYALGDMPSSDAVWGSVLRGAGFYRYAVENTCPDCYTAGDFCKDNPAGTFVLAFGGHVATVVDGDLYDSWDSSREIPIYYWSK